MAKSAVTELTDQIEAIRQEAYNEGYAAAMRAVTEFSTSGSAKTTTVKATTAKSTSAKRAKPAKSTSAKPAKPAKPTIAMTGATQRKTRAPAKSAVRRFRRGDNARHIVEALISLPDRTGPAAAIKKILAEKGHDIPYTSIRHGLGQLQARGEASVAGDGRTWSYTATQH